ncbi:MAG: alpha-2-macroglobulin family protein, partial [Fluviicola sp.]
FRSNDYSMYLYSSNYSNRNWSTQNFTTLTAEDYIKDWYQNTSYTETIYPSLNWYGYTVNSRNRNFGFYANAVYSMDATTESYAPIVTDEISEEESGGEQQFRGGKGDEIERDYRFGKGLGSGKDKLENKVNELALETEKQEPIKVRTNFSETAFFYPQLRTDKNGNVVVNFTVPEALTRWKVLGLAHTKDLKVGTTQNSLVTQKDLMIQANAPRFVREGDKFYFAAKITNLSEENVTGVSELLLFDAATMQPVDVKFKHTATKQNFTIEKGQSTAVFWELDVPEGISALKYRVTAKTQKHSDGEEMVLPILSNRELVTEALPLPSRGIGTKSWTFDKLIASKGNTSLKHHKLTLEYTSNPAWYAVQSLPYLMEYPHECAEQTFSRFYANALASQIIQSNPKIKQIFEQWKTSSPESFLSNLEKNQDLKNVVLEETPWVLESQDQSERKKRVALLFDLNKMDNQLERAIDKLTKMQLPSGAWPWFSGMYENRYITQHIVTGIGHLRNLEVKQASENKQLDRMLKQAIAYLDYKLQEDYIELQQHNAQHDNEIYVSESQIQYLYARAYFKELEINPKHKEAFEYYTNQAEKMWLRFPIQTQAMIAFQANRHGRPEVAKEILASLKERSIDNEEMGIYWKENTSGFGWYEAPIENQAILIEAFDEITNDQKMVEGMKFWLLKNKQTNDWKTTKATADACYALLLRGVDLLVAESTVEIKMNNQVIDPKQLGLAQEAGTGYFKTSWSGTEIKPEMGNISVTRKTEGVSWGAVYWQYFEDLDKITSAETPLKLKKELFVVKNTDNGPVITPITETTELKVGDKVRVRIVLKSDRDMEFVHMKDLRAAGFEPINVISSYKWQEGLGYYESTKDVATHFFFDFLPKGTFVFEYDLRVSLNGQFSNGITSIESMYAPEFRSHSNGMNVKIAK